MNLVESKHVFKKGEATPEEIMRILGNAPTGSVIKVLPFMNGDLKELVVKYTAPAPPSAEWGGPKNDEPIF